MAAEQRSRELELVAREADRHSRRAFELAAKHAHYAARSEFIAALRLLAQALDAQYDTDRHSRALAAGLQAIDEADDFVPKQGRLEADLDMSEIVGAHRTPVLNESTAGHITPMRALQEYLVYAQKQLASAAHHEVAGSMALRGLGKLHEALATERDSSVRAVESKAVTFYQAALLVDPQNYMAANDLGVLLARHGRYEDARRAVEHSIAVRPNPASWGNLAVIYDRLGLADRAGKARQLAQDTRPGSPRMLGARSAVGPVEVEWVDPSNFAQTGGGPVPPASKPPSGAPDARLQPSPPPGRTAGPTWWPSFMRN
jgi:tetratricopeptide (TPR) repeat protein